MLAGPPSAYFTEVGAIHDPGNRLQAAQPSGVASLVTLDYAQRMYLGRPRRDRRSGRGQCELPVRADVRPVGGQCASGADRHRQPGHRQRPGRGRGHHTAGQHHVLDDHQPGHRADPADHPGPGRDRRPDLRLADQHQVRRQRHDDRPAPAASTTPVQFRYDGTTWIELNRSPLTNVVPVGGSVGQALVKTGPTDFATGWGTFATTAYVDASKLPLGGGPGQSLIKSSGTDYDVAWGKVTPGARWTAGVPDSGWHYLGGAGEPALNYGAPFDVSGTVYSPGRFRRDGAGCVFIDLLRGYYSPDQTTPIFTLPPGYRPAYTLTFNGLVGTGSSFGQIVVASTGAVLYWAGANPCNFLQFGNVTFMAEDAQSVNWQPLTLQGGWTNQSGGFAPARYCIDSAGDVHYVRDDHRWVPDQRHDRHPAADRHVSNRLRKRLRAAGQSRGRQYCPAGSLHHRSSHHDRDQRRRHQQLAQPGGACYLQPEREMVPAGVHRQRLEQHWQSLGPCQHHLQQERRGRPAGRVVPGHRQYSDGHRTCRDAPVPQPAPATDTLLRQFHRRGVTRDVRRGAYRCRPGRIDSVRGLFRWRGWVAVRRRERSLVYGGRRHQRRSAGTVRRTGPQRARGSPGTGRDHRSGRPDRGLRRRQQRRPPGHRQQGLRPGQRPARAAR